MLAATACTPSAPAVPTAVPAKPAEATKPAASPVVASPATVASPAASPAASPSPAATVASPAASPVASPAASASPSASPSPVTVAPAPSSSSDPAGRITGTFTLPNVPIAQFQNATMPGSVQNDRGMLLGGIGSDMWRGANDAPGEFWVITDRGPNGQIRVDGANRRTFPIPEFAPAILRVKADGAQLSVVESMAIVGQSGKPVTGLSNVEGYDEVPYDFTAGQRVPYNASGLDAEGLVRTRAGEFWVAEEYSPSIARIGPTGKVEKRYIPQGVKLEGADYPVADTLPAIYGKRKQNRGFEGLAISADEKTLYVALQSPLLNPDTPTGNASRNTRILAFDIAGERVTAEYPYRFEPAVEFDPKAKGAPEEMKVSGIVALAPDTLMILERTDWVARLYTVQMSPATNIAGGKWADPATSPTLESLADPASADVKVLPKSLVIDLSTLPGMPDKIEGVSIIDRSTIAVINDNDFDIGDFDAAGNNVGKAAKTTVLTISLARPLPLP